jgi:hypothetical protein
VFFWRWKWNLFLFQQGMYRSGKDGQTAKRILKDNVVVILYFYDLNLPFQKLALQFQSKLLVIFLTCFAFGETKREKFFGHFCKLLFSGFKLSHSPFHGEKSYKLFPYLSETCLTVRNSNKRTRGGISLTKPCAVFEQNQIKIVSSHYNFLESFHVV